MLRHELARVVQDELARSRMSRLGFFNPAAVDRLLGDHMAGRHNREGILWALLCFSIWCRVTIESESRQPYRP